MTIESEKEKEEKQKNFPEIPSSLISQFISISIIYEEKEKYIAIT